ncbi:MAG TPA: phosphoketolase family protein [Gemmatimonadaceae bacterium]|nr:phosphoketolase family protein [Gemmatimonadaceae bacterium]
MSAPHALATPSREQMKGSVELLDRTFLAANYLSAAQLYLKDNVLLREPLAPQHIKARLLGHWGTVPGINLLYAHLGRLVRDRGQRVLFVVGTGHGAPGVLANTFLDGTLGERYPQYSRDAAGVAAMVHAFSWPGGFPSHLTALTPGTLHEGGELGYSLVHAPGAAMDYPDLLVACLVGDGEAETGPLAGSWHWHRFLNPARDGVVLPVLHLNGYKLSGPSLFARLSRDELAEYFAGMGYEAREVAGEDRALVHRSMWDTLDWAYDRLGEIRYAAREGGTSPRSWPVIVLRTPKGWTGPKSIDGQAVENTFHAHQIPIEDPRTNPDHLRALERWLRSYHPEELFDAEGRPIPDVTAMYPVGDMRLGACPVANGGAVRVALECPDPTAVAVDAATPGETLIENTRVLGSYLREVFNANERERNFRLFCPDETSSNRLQNVFEATLRSWMLPLVPTDEYLSITGRVMEILSEHCCEGWLEGYVLSGRHGIFACYEAFLTIVDSMVQQFAKWQKMATEVAWRVPTASLNLLVTSHVWEQDHNGYSHQGPSFINLLLTKKAATTRVYLPPDANTLLVTMRHCLQTTGDINLIVASKKPMPQWLDTAEAEVQCAAGASHWEWAGHDPMNADIVLAAAGDVPTRETLAAAWWLRRLAPQLRVRVVNVIDLFALQAPGDDSHCIDEERFAALFGTETHVILAFHGYPDVIHELIHHRPHPQRFHVRGYMEEGTTTTPFNMLVLNRMSRYDLAIEALRRAGRTDGMTQLEAKLSEHRAYIVANGEDMPEVMHWRWSA